MSVTRDTDSVCSFAHFNISDVILCVNAQQVGSTLSSDTSYSISLLFIINLKSKTEMNLTRDTDIHTISSSLRSYLSRTLSHLGNQYFGKSTSSCRSCDATQHYQHLQEQGIKVLSFLTFSFLTQGYVSQMPEQKRVYYTIHADNLMIRHGSHDMMQTIWPLIEDLRESRDHEQAAAYMVESHRLSCLENTVRIVNSYATPKLQLQEVGRYMFLLSGFAKSLVSWPYLDRTGGRFDQDHAMLLEREMQYFELHGLKAAFMVHFQVTFGEIFRDLDARRGTRIIQVPQASSADGQLRVMDFARPIHAQAQKKVTLIENPKERLELFSSELADGGQELFALATTQRE